MAKAKRPDISPSRKTQRERTEKNKRAKVAAAERRVVAKRVKVANKLSITVRDLVAQREEKRQSWRDTHKERRSAFLNSQRGGIAASIAAAKREGLLTFPGMNNDAILAPKTKQRVHAR